VKKQVPGDVSGSFCRTTMGKNDERLEELMVALNRQLFDESIGLPCDQQELDRLTGELEQEYRQAATDPDRRDMALDGLADMLATRWHQRWLDAVDSVLIAPNLAMSGALKEE